MPIIKVAEQKSKGSVTKMLCNSRIDGNLNVTRILCLIFLSFYISAQLSSTLHIPDQDSSETEAVPENNSTEDDLYVIKAVVYEIGILTDADNSTNATTERQDVKLSFYNPPSKDNGS